MNWFALLSYAFVSCITPGPNNLMCMANGTNHGFRKGLKFCFGVTTGFTLILLLAIGCNLFIYHSIPAILRFMTPIGALYILWLAWIIWQDKPKEKKESKLQLDTTSFHAGLLLQFVNPKGLLYGMTLITNFVFPYDRTVGTFALVLAFNWVVVLLSTICWLLCGSVFQKLFERYRKLLNAVMALLLVYCTVSLFL